MKDLDFSKLREQWDVTRLVAFWLFVVKCLIGQLIVVVVDSSFHERDLRLKDGRLGGLGERVPGAPWSGS